MDFEENKEALEYFKECAKAEMKSYLDALKLSDFSDSFRLLQNAKKLGKRVHVTGVGKPSYVAGYIASLMSSTGTAAYVLNATEAIHGSSGQVLEGDVVIAISNSGETEELKSTVLTLKKNGAKIISVTGSPLSWLAKQGDALLLAGVEKEGGPLNKAPRISYVAETVVLQALSVILQNADEVNLKDYKKWHPGGSLGKSIN